MSCCLDPCRRSEQLTKIEEGKWPYWNVMKLKDYSCFICENREYRIAGNFRERKLSQILRFCGYLGKFSLQNLGTSEQSAKNFPMKILFPTSLVLRNFLIYSNCATVIAFSKIYFSGFVCDKSSQF